jgi:hypothetical protein
MKNETVNFIKLETPNFEKIFEVSSDESAISRVVAFEPELRGRSIVLPIQFTKTDNTQVLLGFTLDADHLRDLFQVYDFPETIES